MKNKKLFIILGGLILFLVMLFLYRGNLGNNLSEKVSKGGEKNVRFKKQITGKNNNLKFTKKEIKKFKAFKEKVANYEPLLKSIVKSFCSGKKNIIEVTCSSSYFVNEPRFYSMIYVMSSKNNLEYEKLLTYVYQLLKSNCNISSSGLEVLFRKIKLNDNTCYKKGLEKYNNMRNRILSKLDELEEITPNNIDQIFNIYYYNDDNNYIPDIKEKKLQILILSGINNKIKNNGLTQQKFVSYLRSYYKISSIDNLKEKIINKYESIFKDYKLEGCGLKINGYENCFLWGKVKSQAFKCLKQKLNQKIEKDMNYLFKLVAVYSYLSKDFLGAKFRAKASFGPKGVGLINLLDVYTLSKGN